MKRANLIELAIFRPTLELSRLLDLLGTAQGAAMGCAVIAPLSATLLCASAAVSLRLYETREL